MKIEHGLIRDQVFIVFGEDYNRHPHALEHILRPLFGSNTFLWVETIGLRSPKLSLYDLKRILEKLRKMFFSKAEVLDRPIPLPENFTILSPMMIPYNQFSFIRSFNEWSVKRAIRRQLKRVSNDTRPITITSVPNSCDYIGHYHESFKLYFCVDEFSLWPGLDYNLVKRMERELLTKVDMVIATSQALAHSKVINGKKTNVITHGVDFDFFSIPPLLQKNQPAKLCYFGLFDERFDQEIIEEFLSVYPQVEIHIVGNVVCSIDRLKKFPNVIFHGKVDYQKLPEKISSMDIFILPYVRSELTDNINPLKLKEYLALGRPVAATALPEITKLSSYLNIIHTAAHLAEFVKKYEDDQLDHPREKILEYVKNHETWLAKSRLLTAYISRHFVGQDPQG